MWANRLPRMCLSISERPNSLKVRLNASPIDGKANDRLIRLLAGCLGVAPSQTRIVRGRPAREKQVLVTGLCAEELQSRLDPAGPS